MQQNTLIQKKYTEINNCPQIIKTKLTKNRIKENVDKIGDSKYTQRLNAVSTEIKDVFNNLKN